MSSVQQCDIADVSFDSLQQSGLYNQSSNDNNDQDDNNDNDNNNNQRCQTQQTSSHAPLLTDESCQVGCENNCPRHV